MQKTKKTNEENLMIRPEFEGATYYIGTEVEQTPAFSKKTLFVVGYRDTSEIIKNALEHKTQHVFLGASESFVLPQEWDVQIVELLNAGFWVTLNYPITFHNHLISTLSRDIWQNRKFIPVVTMYINQLSNGSPNLTLKFVEKEGVWCWNQKDIKDSNKFTGTVEYENDVIVGEKLVEVLTEKAAPVVKSKVAEQYVEDFSKTSSSSIDSDSEAVTEPASDEAKATKSTGKKK